MSSRRRAVHRLAGIAFAVAAGAAAAQHGTGHYGDLRDRPVKALSAQQLDDLREGRGMGLSLPAELNRVPGPLHVLELREVLALSVEQAEQVGRIRDEMRSAARRIGGEIIDGETALERAFGSGAADESVVTSATTRLGRLHGELRAVHLIAHLRTAKLLTPAQIAAYDEARGYAKAAGQHGKGHKHSH